MSGGEFAGIGFAPGVVRGARSFKVDNLGRLTGIHFPQVWRPGENVAECRKSDETFFTFPTTAWFAALSSTTQAATAMNHLAGQMSPQASGRPLENTTKQYPTSASQFPKRGRKRRGYPSAPHPDGVVPFPPIEFVQEDPPVLPDPPQHSMDNCSCGFYAYYDGSDDYYKPGLVSGVVEGYGEALIGSRGFRVSRARIVALMVPAEQDRFANRIRRNYAAIPIFTRFADMVAEFSPDGGELGRAPDTDPDFWTRSV